MINLRKKEKLPSLDSKTREKRSIDTAQEVRQRGCRLIPDRNEAYYTPRQIKQYI